MMMKLSWKAVSRARLVKRTLNWQGRNLVYLDFKSQNVDGVGRVYDDWWSVFVRLKGGWNYWAM